VLVLDILTAAFDRLPSSFGGTALRGDGTDEDVLKRAGAEGADVFLALTEGDNRNVMAAQLAAEELSIERVIAKINDPLRAKAYAELGIATLCRTGLMVTPSTISASRPAACPGCWPGEVTTLPRPGQPSPPNAAVAQPRPRRPRTVFMHSRRWGKVGYCTPRNSSDRAWWPSWKGPLARGAGRRRDRSIVIPGGCQGKYLGRPAAIGRTRSPR
jgi:trk system potassium uptake protein TrkA